jgi:hypothetical protein
MFFLVNKKGFDTFRWDGLGMVNAIDYFHKNKRRISDRTMKNSPKKKIRKIHKFVIFLIQKH